MNTQGAFPFLRTPVHLFLRLVLPRGVLLFSSSARSAHEPLLVCKAVAILTGATMSSFFARSATRGRGPTESAWHFIPLSYNWSSKIAVVVRL